MSKKNDLKIDVVFKSFSIVGFATAYIPSLVFGE